MLRVACLAGAVLLLWLTWSAWDVGEAQRSAGHRWGGALGGVVTFRPAAPRNG